MTTRMLINATVADELRVAIVEDGELVDLDIESAEQSTIRGNIYKGIVHNVEGSLEAAFIDFGAHKQGFLPFSEVAPSQYGREHKKGESPRITEVLKRGQEIIVQAAKDPVGEKGAALTTYLSLPGRFTVLMPGSDAKGVSRKIEDETERKKIKALAAKINVPEGCGFIIRTAGLGQPKTTLQKDLDRLAEIYDKIKRTAEIARPPSLLHAEPDVIARTLRDLFNDEIDEVWIDSREEYEAAKAYFEELMPEYVERLFHYQNPIPIFAYYHVEPQIEATYSRRVELPSGGSIVIDETEALVAVDVNSGKMSGGDHEDTVYRTNFEAAQVVARQLRLRDLGGIVVVDFIDMEMKRNERAVEKALRDATKTDKARVKISRITSNGLCILTRQRIRQGLRKSFQRRCTVCQGTGWLRTPESHSLSLLKRIETRLAQGEVGEVRVTTHKETAEHLLNVKRSELLALEREYRCKIIISARLDMERDADDVTYLSMGEVLAEITDKLPAREEPRKNRGEKRKRGKKKKDARAGAAAHEAAEAAEAEVEAEGEARKKRRRKSREERVEARRERAAQPQGQAQPQAADGAPADEARGDGPTFTGRPPPEVLARMKAEREARRAARLQGNAKPPQPPPGWVAATPLSSDRPHAADGVTNGELPHPLPEPEPAAAVTPDTAAVTAPMPEVEREPTVTEPHASEPPKEAAARHEAPVGEPPPSAEDAEAAPKRGIFSRLLGGRRSASARSSDEDAG